MIRNRFNRRREVIASEGIDLFDVSNYPVKIDDVDIHNSKYDATLGKALSSTSTCTLNQLLKIIFKHVNNIDFTMRPSSAGNSGSLTFLASIRDKDGVVARIHFRIERPGYNEIIRYAENYINPNFY